MEDSADEFEEENKFSRFKTIKKPGRDDILEKRNNNSTREATKVWMKCFNDYLKEKNLPNADALETKDLPEVLEGFYTELRKADGEGEYKTSTLKCIRAALNRHYKEKRSLDIIANESFTWSNLMFKGVTKIAKEEGRGETDSRPPIEPEDLQTLQKYFAENLAGPPNPYKLQEMMLFNIIYYMGRRGRQNLRKMTKETYAISTDASGKRYIYQAIKEQDKNHAGSDMSPNNQARIYENPGNFIQSNCDIIFMK